MLSRNHFGSHGARTGFDTLCIRIEARLATEVRAGRLRAEDLVLVAVDREDGAAEVRRDLEDGRCAECQQLARRRRVLVRLVKREIQRGGARGRVGRREVVLGEGAEARRIDLARGAEARD